MVRKKVWDPVVRLFHWSLVMAFAANAFFTNPEKSLHHVIGYVVLSLVLIRVLWGFTGTNFARFRSFPPSPARALGQLADVATGRRRVHLGHTPLGALMIYNLLLTMLVIGASGFAMTTNAFFGIEWVKGVHEASVTWAEISVVLHVVAVIWESRRTGVNLPKAMVTGYKDIPAESLIAE